MFKFPATVELQLVTSASGDVDYVCDYRRTAGDGPFSLTHHQSNSTLAETKTIIGGAASVLSRAGWYEVCFLSVKNAASTVNTVMLQVLDGGFTEEITGAITLQAEEFLILNENGLFVFNANGGLKSGAVGKVLAQSAPSATTETDLYTVPAAKIAKLTSLFVANRGAAATFRVSVSVTGGATANKDYLHYDVAIGANSTIQVDGLGYASATDKVRVYASTANLSFNLFGEEA
jgi:hypothetical protein